MPEDTTAPEAGATPPAESPEEPRLTQAQVDTIIKDRLARQKQQFGNVDEYKAKAARLDEIEQASKTEIEKATERASTAEGRTAELERTLSEMQVRTAVISRAAAKGIIDPDAAVALLDRSTLQLDDDGVPKNVDQALDQLIEAKPYLTGTTGQAARPGGFDGGVRTTAPAGRNDTMNHAIRQAAGRA